jgi:hypothetical protein
MSVRVRRTRAHEAKAMSVRVRRRRCAHADAPLVIRTSRVRMNRRRCARVHAPQAMRACAFAAGDARERINSRRCAPPSKDPLPGCRPNLFLEEPLWANSGQGGPADQH